MQNNLYSFISIMQKAGKISSGAENVEKDIKKGTCMLLIISEDANESTKENFKKLTQNKHIPCIYFGLKLKLGNSIGKSPRSCIAIKDKGFSNSFLKKFTAIKNGGEYIDQNENL